MRLNEWCVVEAETIYAAMDQHYINIQEYGGCGIIWET